jgi:solute carrier family 8 (sodium/calcium exchanger)
MEMQILQKYGKGAKALSNSEIAQLMQEEFGEKASRAQRRVEATRKLTGGKVVSKDKGVNKVCALKDGETGEAEDEQCEIGFASNAYSVLEGCGHLTLAIERSGGTKGTAVIAFKTKADNAIAGVNFKHTEGEIEFTDGGDKEKVIEVEILDNDQIDADNFFWVELSIVKAEGVKVELGIASTHIRIVDDDDPGKIVFEKDTFYVKEDTKVVMAKCVVERQGGAKGEIKCKYKTEDITALAPRDYEAPKEGAELIFADGQTKATVEIPINPRGRYEDAEKFRIILFEPSAGGFVEHRDGGKDEAICEVVIESDAQQQERFARVMSELRINFDAHKIGYSNWKDQITAAIYPSADSTLSGVSALDWVMHIITVFWKVLFALIPPVDYCGGWLCFVCALAMIGLVTAFIGDLASLLGCVLGIPDQITAITFVALGTSLPDTFASKQAATEDDHADASIGNVTGSNSVNVFLGLGLPWMVGAVYWNITDPPSEWLQKYGDVASHVIDSNSPKAAFVVVGGSLGFSVGIFTCTAVTCLAILVIRRAIPSIGAELGGPKIPKFVTSVFLVFLWFVYISLSSWKAIQDKGPCD